MCTVGDDLFDSEAQKLIKEPQINPQLNKCNKCRQENPSVVLRGKDPYCKTCFLLNTTHKFKSELGKSKLIRPNDRILIHHKLGHASTALLHLLRTGVDLNTPKKLRFIPTFLIIDDQYQLSVDERKKMIEEVKAQVENFTFKVYTISLSQYVWNPDNVDALINLNCNVLSEKDDENLWKSIKISETNKNELRNIYIKRLLVDVARHLQCNFIFTPEISTDVASSLLSNISLGKYQITNDTGFCDDRHQDIRILKPLRHFDIKEIVFYNKFHDLAPISVRETPINPFDSIQNLTKKFVENLQGNFPATVSTVLRTGDKLVNDREGVEICNLCKISFRKHEEELTAREAIEVSINASLGKLNLLDDNKFNEKDKQGSLYCYSCSKLIQLNCL